MSFLPCLRNGIYNNKSTSIKVCSVLFKSRHLLPRNLLRRLTTKAAFGGEEMAKSVGENHNFPKEEEKIIELWNKLDAFKTSLKQSEGKPK